uniref:MARVEL domain-containing protein n=1 Tax=Graphocephala atropunctata TaxID=36148 RepID=A0A1B6K935_9HEMI
MNFKLFVKVFQNLLLKLIALCLTVTCLVLWQTEDENSYYRLPAKNPMELNIYFFAIPAYTVILSGLVLLHVLGELPDKTTLRVMLIVGISMFTLSGTIGAVNCTDHAFPSSMLAISVLCCVIASILVLEYLSVENFFKKKEKPDEPLPEVDLYAKPT